jgi:hypothetical protein
MMTPNALARSAYWDIDTTKQTNGSSGGTGLTTLQLQRALPAAFDPAIWAISYGASYPYLTVPNRWVPAVSSPSRTFPSRTTSFWGSLALAETKQGRFAVFPAGQIFPWEYHEYTKRNVSSNSMAANFAMLGRLIGSGKPKARVPYGDRTSDPLSLAKIDYFTGADGSAVWPLSNPNFTDVKFFAGAVPVDDPAKASPASFNRADILTQLENGRLVMLQGSTGHASTHWMLATAIMKNQNGDVTGIVANDPLLGQQVIIDMVQGSPTFRKVTEPADYQALSGITFSTARYFSVALK